MSAVRRAMAEMGLAGCCAWCDAPDTPGSERCRACIATHQPSVTDWQPVLTPQSTKPHATSSACMAEPHRHDHDQVHGPVLREQMRRLGVASRNHAATQADVEAAFAASRARDKGSVVSSVSNRLGDALEAATARQLGEEVFDPEQTRRRGQADHSESTHRHRRPVGSVGRRPGPRGTYFG
ncbi:MAG: hypothetical protein CM15mP18_1730 [Methanobacteriota archaeon]|nr:MAG: hypothetical protein CM15mP18_1730 [Euryarchaeota archaeon]